jgi:membrane dipeptidase
MKKIYLIGLSLAIFACKVNKTPEIDYQKKAVELAHKYIMVDGHVDLPYRLKVKSFQMQKEFTGIPVETKEGDFD